jgi:glycosyltransferase involved in cell wall biosynthesis
VNEPVGILRLVDPFRAGDGWVSIAPSGYRVTIAQVSWPPRASDVARIAALAARDGTRIVHAHGKWANLVAVPAARLVRAKAVCTAGSQTGFVEAVALRAADAVMCSSQEQRNRCVRRAGVRAARVCVVHPGVELGRFAVRAPDPKPLIVAVGSLRARNGHLELVEAVARLRVPGLRVVCAGEGPLRPVLEQRIAHLGLRGTIDLPGHVGDVPALLASAHAAWTSGPRATIEAMAAGVPVASPWHELIGAGIAVRFHDAAALADRLLALLADRKLGATLRKRAEKEFSLDAFRARLGAMYDALLAPERAAA